MRIAHFYPWALQGEFGTAIAVRGWCRALAEHGASVRLIAAPGSARATLPPGVEVSEIPDRPLGLHTPRFLRARMSGADVVVLHGGWEPSDLVAARAARDAQIPYVVMPHGVYFPQVFERRKVALKRAWWVAFERGYLRNAAAIHLFFPDEIDHLARRGIQRPTVIAPNGFTAPEGVRWSPGPEPYIVWLGRFDPQHKGLDLLVEAMAMLPPAERPRLRLHGVDWHGQRAIVARMVRERRLEGSISLHDPVYGQDKWRVMSGASAFVYPSRWDASPISVVEALSIGLPTLVTPFPLGSFVASRGAALLAHAEAGALAEGLRRLMSGAADDLAPRAAELVANELSWTAVASTWVDEVGAILAGARRDGTDGPTVA